MDYAVSVEHVSFSYGSLLAVDDVSFKVEEGQVFSFLGPNGAGKTTLINLLITLLPVQKGRVTVAGFDVSCEKKQVRRSIGVVFQDQRLDRDLTVWETLDFHGRLHYIPESVRRPHIEELLELVELSDKRGELTRNLSGGMKRRLEVARGLVAKPKVLFLDEPTIGLDAKTRKRIWSYIREVNGQGVTVFLTTHYMDEADQNSDVVCIIDRGRIVTTGTPQSLKSSLGRDYVNLQTDDNERALGLLEGVSGVGHVGVSFEGLRLHLEEGSGSINGLIDILRAKEVKIVSVNFVKPTLEDVFIDYTGRGFSEANHRASQ